MDHHQGPMAEIYFNNFIYAATLFDDITSQMELKSKLSEIRMRGKNYDFYDGRDEIIKFYKDYSSMTLQNLMPDMIQYIRKK